MSGRTRGRGRDRSNVGGAPGPLNTRRIRSSLGFTMEVELTRRTAIAAQFDLGFSQSNVLSRSGHEPIVVEFDLGFSMEPVLSSTVYLSAVMDFGFGVNASIYPLRYLWPDPMSFGFDQTNALQRGLDLGAVSFNMGFNHTPAPTINRGLEISVEMEFGFNMNNPLTRVTELEVEFDLGFNQDTDLIVAVPYDMVLYDLDGSTVLTRGGGLTGAADNKTITFSLWLDPATGGVTNTRFLTGTNALNGGTGAHQISAWINSSGAVGIYAESSAGTSILNATSSAGAADAGDGLVHVMGSIDLSSTSLRHIYINDVLDSGVTWTTYTNDTIDWTLADWGIGAFPDGAQPYDGELGDMWVNNSYIDFSVEANRRKFIDAFGNPVNLGSDGSIPTGSAPLIFMSGANWETNKGSGGGFSVPFNGTLRSAVQNVGLFADAVILLDAADAASYGGSGQTWTNRAATGSAYDFYRGTTSGSDASDPTFNGTPGSKNYSNYWLMTNSMFTIAAGANTAFLDSLHKDNAEFTVLSCAAMNSGSTERMHVFGTVASSAQTGFALSRNGATFVYKGSIGVPAATFTPDANIPTGTSLNTFETSGLSIDEAGTGFFYDDGAYVQVGASNTFNAAYSAPAAGAATYPMQIGALGNGTTTNTGAKLSWFAMFNRALSKAEVDALYALMNTRAYPFTPVTNTYNSGSGNEVAPVGYTTLELEIWSGGASGGEVNNNTRIAGIAGNSSSANGVTVPGGGAPAALGSPGQVGGVGVLPTGGDINTAGGNGANGGGQAGTVSNQGAGGSSPNGGAGGDGVSIPSTGNYNGDDGIAPGGGGSGDGMGVLVGELASRWAAGGAAGGYWKKTYTKGVTSGAPVEGANVAYSVAAQTGTPSAGSAPVAGRGAAGRVRFTWT